MSSTPDAIDPQALEEATPQAPVGPSFWERTEAGFEKVAERFNPILVKEARQAMKSLQFVITFSLLIVCGWAWTALAMAIGFNWYGLSIYYQPIAPWVLTGYYAVLSAPMLIIVPFAAFRSLASEREDGTFELLSITSLTSRQIVTGKLGSSILQMIVYYSALSPCIAFTYLLRGIDVLSIVLVLLFLFMASVLLSSFSLLMATFTKSQVWQVLLSILLLVGLLIAYFTGLSIIFGWMESGVATAYDLNEFWMAQVCWITFYITFLVLFILAAAAQISFPSDNRSTKLRVVMFSQNLLIVGWFVYLWLHTAEEQVFAGMFCVSALYWAIMGGLMIGETAELSPRVRRQLPQSLLARSMFTWFNPGSGTGYFFALGTYLLNVAVVVFVAALGVMLDRPGYDHEIDLWIIGYGMLAGGYLAAYLGFSRVLVRLMRLSIEMGLFRSFAVTLFLVSMGIVVPLLIGSILEQHRLDYSWLQATNWGWTMIEAVDNNLLSQNPIVPVLVFLATSVMVLVNFITTAKEIDQTRVEAPQRVLEDDASRRPAKVKPAPTSPWDEPEEPSEPEEPPEQPPHPLDR